MTLVGYWPLNEDSDATEAKDHSGNENHGTINDGGDSTIPGANGIIGQNAYSFDGNNDYVEIPDSSSLSPQEKISISSWVFTSGNFGDWTIVGKEDSYQNQLVSSNSIQNSINDCSSWQQKDTSPVLDSGSWNHVVITYDGSYQRTYCNGINVGQWSLSGNICDTSTNIYLGSWTGNSEFFNGKISEVRIYNRPLTKSEIQYLYNVGKRGQHVTSKKTS